MRDIKMALQKDNSKAGQGTHANLPIQKNI